MRARVGRAARFELLLPLVALLMVTNPRALYAQVAWDSPMLLPPQREAGLGVFLADMHGANLGVIFTWHAPGANYGLRAGLAEGSRGDDLGVFGGVDFVGRLHRSTQDFPIDIDWLFGAGLGVSNGARLSVPLGLTGGHTFRAEGAHITPYLSPRVILDGFFGRDRDRDDSSLHLRLAADLGLDLRLLSGRGVTIRFGATIGGRDAIAIGLVF